MLVEQVSKGKRPVLKDIAVACGIEETRPSKWNRKPEFRAAIARALKEAACWLVEAAHVSQLQVAIAGSLPHYQTQLRRLGIEAPAGAPFDPTQASAGLPGSAAFAVAGTHIHIHAIPEPAPRSTLPPPLELPAAQGAVTSIPPK